MVADRVSRHDEVGAAPWFGDRAAWRFVARGYLPCLAVMSLVWEIAHSPLYTLWRDATAGYIAFAVAHCTLGDILIGAAALLLALVILRQPALARWQWRRIAALTTLLGLAYTVFSEWMNVSLLRSWSYTDSMPIMQLGETGIGVTPLLQWTVVPIVSLSLARRQVAVSPARRS